MDGSSTPSEDGDATLGPGTRLGKYEIVRLLGAGGMGAVYEAAHTEIGKRVAVKVLSPSIAAIPGTRGRFLREAQLASRVRHPNIVDVTDVGSEGGRTFLVMELFRGEDLAQRVARAGQLSPQEVADIMLPVCSGVVAAHDAGVTHRDLKPSNIFLSESQHAIEPKILDFGISKSMDSNLGPDALTGTGAMVGTPFYLAPEQIMDNRSAGPASDQYALGVILYECLTGVRPFQNDSLYAAFRDIVAGAPRPPRSHRPDIPPSLEQIVLRAMHVDASGRYDSTRDLGRALLPFASDRVRSIWQDAFGSDGSDQPAAFGVSPASEVPTGRAVAVTRVLTPSANARPSGPGGPVGLAGGTQIAAPVGSFRSRSGRLQVPQSDDVPDTLDVGPRSSPLLLRLGIAGGLAVAGLIAWLALKDPPTVPGLSESGKKRRRSLAPRPEAATVDPESAREPGNAGFAEAVPTEVFKLSVTVEPETALIELDGRPVGRGRLERSLPLDHQPHRMRLVAEGYDPEIVEFTDVPPPTQITLTRVVARAVDRKPPEQVQTASQRRRRRGADGRAQNTAQGTRQDQRQETTRARDLNPNGAPIIY